jgi:threonine dehydratase
MSEAAPLTAADVALAADRIGALVRRAVFSLAEPASLAAAPVWLVHEYMQHTGSFKARGALNFTLAATAARAVPGAGITIASGGNAGLACAWAARLAGVGATVFLPETAPQVKVARLAAYGAEVRRAGGEYADAAAACAEFAARSGALMSHAYDHPLIAAGAGTLLAETVAATGGIDTIVVAVGGGGLLSGICAAAGAEPIRVVAVEPGNCRALNAALAAGGPVDVPVDSIAADSLGARRVSVMAHRLAAARQVTSVLVPDSAIAAARRALWDQRRVAVEPGGATALAALMCGAYLPAPGERVAAVLCGANTDPADLAG